MGDSNISEATGSPVSKTFAARYAILRNLDVDDYPPFALLRETPDGGAFLHVFEEAAAVDVSYSRLRREFPDFGAALLSWQRGALISAYGIEGDDAFTQATLEPPISASDVASPNHGVTTDEETKGPPPGHVIPVGDERCTFTMDACICMKRRGHDGLHACAHGGWSAPPAVSPENE